MAERNHKAAGWVTFHERRQSIRFNIRGTVSFHWQTSEGHWDQGSGLTRDMGKAGAFVETASPPPIASPVRVVVTFFVGTSDDVPVRFSGTGDVRHVQQGDNGGVGYGAAVVFYRAMPAPCDVEYGC